MEVSHTDSAGRNDISAWQSYTTRGGRHLAFGVSCHGSAWVMWRCIHSCSPDTNFMMFISARHWHFPKSSSASSHIEPWHESVCKRSQASVYVSSQSHRHTVLNNKAKDMCPLGGEIAHYLWATFHLHSWLLWEPLWLWWKSHKPLLGDSTGLTADTLMDSFVIGREGNDSVS